MFLVYNMTKPGIRLTLSHAVLVVFTSTDAHLVYPKNNKLTARRPILLLVYYELQPFHIYSASCSVRWDRLIKHLQA